MSTFHMILEHGVLKAVPLPEKPVVFRGEIHGNAKWMGGLYPCRGSAVEVVTHAPTHQPTAAPIIQQAPAEDTRKIELPKPIILNAPVSAFATATIAFDEDESEPIENAPTNEPAIEPVESVAKSLATEDVRGVGMTLKDFSAYQLKGAQVRKLYEILVSPDSAEVGINKMTKAIIEESGRSDERKIEVVRAILDVKRGAL